MKTKRLCCLLLALTLAVGLLPMKASADAVWDGSIAAGFASGSGTEADPYMIETAAQLAYLAQSVNNGTSYSGKFIKLGADIVLNDTSKWENWDKTAPSNTWTAIGNYDYPFEGTLDGNGHTVSGIYINTVGDYQGLFGRIEGYNIDGGTVKNLGVIESYISASNCIGGVAGSSSGVVDNCYNTGVVVSGGDIFGCVGGVIGNVDPPCTIMNCYNTGAVTGNRNVGGVVGLNCSGVVKKCYNKGAVAGDLSVGGVVGCYYSTCTYNGARYDGAITDCYNMGGVTGDDFVGGVLSDNAWPDDNYDNVMNCYNAGAVVGNNHVGGVIGNYGGAGRNCYYLDICVSNPTNTTGTALTDAQMIQQATFIDFDFDAVWTMAGNADYPYPELQVVEMIFEIVPGDVIGDDKLNILDVMAIINIITGSLTPTDTQKKAADFNGDGSINILDAMALINQITGA